MKESRMNVRWLLVPAMVLGLAAAILAEERSAL